jgi:hypothetical protein
MDNWLPLIIIALPLAIIGGILYFVQHSLTRQSLAAQRRDVDQRSRAERGVWAGATVISATTQAGTQDPARGLARVRLLLLVTPPGGKTYQATTTWLVEQAALPHVQSGQGISVRIDAADPQRVYPAAPWARPYEG